MKTKPIFPRLMWADYDPTCKHMPIAVYATKADQRGNRPELEPIRVLVALPNSNWAELEEKLAHLRAFAADDSRKIKRLCDLLVRADNALAHCGVGKLAPVRANINAALKNL